MSTTDAKLQTATFENDPLNRRIRASYSDGAVATFAYDAAGRLVLADDSADPHQPITRDYDNLDLLLAETTALGTVSYQYDSLGRRRQMIVGGQAPVAYAYDANSRLRTITQEPLNPAEIQYDAAGRRTLLTLPNGVSTEYQYDPTNRVTALIYRGALGPLGDLTYNYDPAGNRTTVGGSFARTLLPDPVSNGTYDAANQQVTFGGNTMAFDPNGSPTSLTDASGTSTFTWDARNRLTTISGSGFAGGFAYDALGRRARRDISGEVREYQYDSADIVRERINGAEVRYLRTLGVDEPLCRIAPDGTAYYVGDALSSTVALTDPAGALATTYHYEPFGRIVSAGGSSPNPFQFTGRENDSGLLYYYRARYYSATAARFVSRDDPRFCNATLPGGANPYLYVYNNPQRFADPSGHGATRPRPEPPSQLDEYARCVESCTSGLVSDNLTRLGNCVATGVPTGAALGVGTCVLLVAVQPYLLPAFPACAGFVGTSTAGLFATACLANFNIGTAAGIGGCLVGCIP